MSKLQPLTTNSSVEIPHAHARHTRALQRFCTFCFHNLHKLAYSTLYINKMQGYQEHRSQIQLRESNNSPENRQKTTSKKVGEILLFLRKRNVHGEGCESKKCKFAGNARAREETCRLFSSSFHPREEQTRMCSFHQSAMHIMDENRAILQHQDGRIKTTLRKKCTFLRFFISLGLLLPISYRGMVATLCYPTLPSQVFFERQGESGKSLWTSLQFALIT